MNRAEVNMRSEAKQCAFAVLAIVAGILVSKVGAMAQSSPPPEVHYPIQQDDSPPLSQIPPVPPGESPAFNHPRGHMGHSGNGQPDPVLQSSATISVSAVSGVSFDGIADNGTWVVPDPNAAVGATQIMEWTNARFAVYSKTGTLLYGPATGNTIWQGFTGPCATTNTGDGIVQYDKGAKRWVFSRHAFNTGGPYYQCVAVSATSDATGSYHRYAFVLPNEFPDYPKLGVWPDGYYLSIDELDSSSFNFLYSLVCALDRTSMLSGASAAEVCFQLPGQYANLLPSDLDGTIAPPSGSPAYFMNFGTNSLNIWKFHVNFQSPSSSTFVGPTNIAVAAFSEACGGGVCIPQSNTQQSLDSLGDRLMYRLAYRHFSDGHESIVVTHSVGSPSGIRWYEIGSPGASPFIRQQGTFRPDSTYRWMGSIAMDKVGDIAVGYSASSGSMHPAIRYTGRVPTDTMGTLEAEKTIIQGGGSQKGVNRWGDYTSLFIDPADDCTFWYTNEYLVTNGSKNWHTRIASFKFSSCQ